LSWALASARKIVDTGLASEDCGRVRGGLSPVIIHGANPHGTKMIENALHAPLTRSASAIAPNTAAVFSANQQWFRRIRKHEHKLAAPLELPFCAALRTGVRASSAPFRTFAAVKVESLNRLCGDWVKVAAGVKKSRRERLYRSLARTTMIVAFRSFVASEESEAASVDCALDAGRRKECVARRFPQSIFPYGPAKTHPRRPTLSDRQSRHGDGSQRNHCGSIPACR